MAGMAWPVVGLAQCELVDVGPNATDLRFGGALAVDGDRLVVGAPGDALVGGAVYIFDRVDQNAFLDTRLALASPPAGAEFGAAVCVEGTTLFVGAPDDDQGGVFTGSVYVFELSAGVWSQSQVLLPSDLPSLAEFGRALDFDGERLVVGARFDSSTASQAGSAYVFEDVAGVWTETAKLSVPVPPDGQLFGSSVAIDGDWLFCGAPGDTQGGAGAGAAFVFNRQGSAWIQTQKLLGTDTDTADQFGIALDVQGDVVMIGAPGEQISPTEPDAGGVYCFDRSGGVWSQCQLLFSPGSETGDEFGASVAFRKTNDRVLIGAPGKDDNGVSSGSVYVFELIGTIFFESDLLFPAEVAYSMAAGERFGEAVAVDGDFALCGSTLGDPLDEAASVGSPARGASYLFSLTETICSTFGTSAVDVSLSLGGSQFLELDAGPAFAGNLYVVAGSASGRDPGLNALGTRIPLNFDSYLLDTLTAPSALVASVGTLDGSGGATVLFTLPPATDPSLVGLVVRHAFVVLGGGVQHVSRPLGVLLVM